MKLKSLALTGPEAYEQWSGLRGHVKFNDENGNETKVVLKPGQISRILRAIANELPEQARENVRGVSNAVQDAIDGGLLLENDGTVNVPNFAPENSPYNNS